jgi:hypothetical protein
MVIFVYQNPSIRHELHTVKIPYNIPKKVKQNRAFFNQKLKIADFMAIFSTI